jgi:mycothiol synthase
MTEPSARAGDIPDDATRAAILALAARIAEEDGAPPLSDDALTHLSAPDVEHVLARDGDRVTGYAQRHDGTAEVAAAPETLDALLDAVDQPGLLVWSHGRRARLAPALRARGYTPVRELHQLRWQVSELPADPPLADGITVRTFRPGRDEDAWLAVNAAAFATHPEQGRMTRADLDALIAEPWFDPSGFLLAERSLRPEDEHDQDGELLGFHWTKIHPDGAGEVYVLGIAPAAQGLGLGKALLVRGLRHLAERGCREVLLYVDGDNTAALRLYERAGFVPYDLDIQWRAPGSPDRPG